MHTLRHSHLCNHHHHHHHPLCPSCRFLDLWTQRVNSSAKDKDSSSDAGAPGDLTPACLLGPEASNGAKALQACQQEFMQQLFADAMSFAGVLWGTGDGGLGGGARQERG